MQEHGGGVKENGLKEVERELHSEGQATTT